MYMLLCEFFGVFMVSIVLFCSVILVWWNRGELIMYLGVFMCSGYRFSEVSMYYVEVLLLFLLFG